MTKTSVPAVKTYRQGWLRNGQGKGPRWTKKVSDFIPVVEEETDLMVNHESHLVWYGEEGYLKKEYNNFSESGDDSSIDELKDYNSPTGDETRLNLACLDHKDIFVSAWKTASRVQDKIDLLEMGSEDEDKKVPPTARTKIDNSRYYQQEREELLLRAQFMTDRAILGMLDSKYLINHFSRRVERIQLIMKNKKSTVEATSTSKSHFTTGHSWTGLGQLKNGYLTLLLKLGVEKIGREWINNMFVEYKGNRLVHDFTTSQRARQERSGSDWNEEVMIEVEKTEECPVDEFLISASERHSEEEFAPAVSVDYQGVATWSNTPVVSKLARRVVR